MSTEKNKDGTVRQWMRCRVCKYIAHYDYVPYGLGGMIAIARCKCGSIDLHMDRQNRKPRWEEITPEEAKAALKTPPKMQKQIAKLAKAPPLVTKKEVAKIMKGPITSSKKKRKANMQREPYIRQGKDTSCQLVVLLNAFIYKFGRSPIKYKSKEYKMLVDIGFGNAGPLIRMREIYTLFGAFTLNPRAPYDLQGWIVSQLDAKHPVAFPIVSPTIGQHQVLLVEHMDSPVSRFFSVANAQFRRKAGVENLAWYELAAAQGFMSLSGLFSIHWHDEEGVRRRLKHPQTYEQAVRDYHHALTLTGYFPKVERKTKRGKAKTNRKAKGRRKAGAKGRASAR